MTTGGQPPWGDCPLVLACELTAVQQGATARSTPPVYNSTLTFTVCELLRGDDFSAGAQLVVSHSARQVEPPVYPAIGALCLLGASKRAARGKTVPQAECLRLEDYMDAVLGCSLPFGWSTDGGDVRSPWANLGTAAWPPAEGSSILAAAGAPVCSVTGRPVLVCGDGSLQFSGAMVPPASAENSAVVSRGNKPKGKWPGGWHEWTNPDGDGDIRLTLTNNGRLGQLPSEAAVLGAVDLG